MIFIKKTTVISDTAFIDTDGTGVFSVLSKIDKKYYISYSTGNIF